MNGSNKLDLKNKIFFFTLAVILLLSVVIFLFAGWLHTLNLIILLGFISLVVIIFVGISYWFSRHITRPMSQLTKMSDEISRGNLDIHPEMRTEIKCWEM